MRAGGAVLCALAAALSRRRPQAALKLCNRTSYILYAATSAMRRARRSDTQGWTRIAPGDCQTALQGAR